MLNNLTAEDIGKELAAKEKAFNLRCNKFLGEINKIVYEHEFFTKKDFKTQDKIDDFITELKESFESTDPKGKVGAYEKLITKLQKEPPIWLDKDTMDTMSEFLKELKIKEGQIDKLQTKLHDMIASNKVVSNNVATQPVQAAKVEDDTYRNLKDTLDEHVGILKTLEDNLAKPTFPKRVYKEIKNTLLSTFSNQPHKSKHDLVKGLREGLDSINLKEVRTKSSALELNDKILSKFKEFDDNRKNKVVFSTAGDKEVFNKIDEMKGYYLKQAAELIIKSPGQEVTSQPRPKHN